jgi:hypothetical protein
MDQNFFAALRPARRGGSLRAKYIFSFLFSQRRQAAKGLPACLPQAGRGGLDFKAT